MAQLCEPADIDQNGSVQTLDLNRFTNFMNAYDLQRVGIAVGSITLTAPYDAYKLDVNADGYVDLTDYLLLLYALNTGASY